MIHEMRLKKRLLEDDEARRILSQGEYGILSTVDADGCPYGVPVSYACADNIIYFHCAKGVGHKVENMEHSQKVCFTVVGPTEVLPAKFTTKYESAIAFGTVRKAEDVFRGLRLLQEKYSPGFPEEGRAYAEKDMDTVAVYEIQIEHVTAKGNR